MTDDVDPTRDGDGDGDDEGDGDGRRLDVTAKQVLIGIALALVVLTLIVVFIGRLAGFSHLATTLHEGDEAWLAVCAGGQIIVFIGYAGAFRLAVRFEGGPQHHDLAGGPRRAGELRHVPGGRRRRCRRNRDHLLGPAPSRPLHHDAGIQRHRPQHRRLPGVRARGAWWPRC